MENGRMTKDELLEKLFHENRENINEGALRFTRVRVPGREVYFAHVIGSSQYPVYRNLALNIGAHAGEDHTGETIGLIQSTPWETAVVAADIAVKSAHVEIGFMDRFNGSLILLGELSEVKSAIRGVLDFFKNELHFEVCDITEN